jgi:hypothetical protein
LELPRRQAKKRLDGFHNGAPNATAEVNRFYRDADKAGFALYRKRILRRPGLVRLRQPTIKPIRPRLAP